MELDFVTAFMREADREEALALGVLPGIALRDSVARSAATWVAWDEREPVALLGVIPQATLLGERGVPWLIGTDAAPLQRRALIALAPVYIGEMLAAFSHLLNYVHADNHAAVRWLRRVGFQVQAAAPYGPRGAMFHRFEMHADGPHNLQPREGRSAPALDAQ